MNELAIPMLGAVCEKGSDGYWVKLYPLAFETQEVEGIAVDLIAVSKEKEIGRVLCVDDQEAQELYSLLTANGPLPWLLSKEQHLSSEALLLGRQPVPWRLLFPRKHQALEDKKDVVKKRIAALGKINLRDYFEGFPPLTGPRQAPPGSAEIWRERVFAALL